MNFLQGEGVLDAIVDSMNNKVYLSVYSYQFQDRVHFGSDYYVVKNGVVFNINNTTLNRTDISPIDISPLYEVGEYNPDKAYRPLDIKDVDIKRRYKKRKN